MSNWRALLPERLRRRWRRLLVFGVVIAVRVALPEVLRRVLVAQASQRLHAQVEIGDVDLSLLRGGIAFDDVALRAAESPDAPAAPPLVAWKRFAVELRWLPLFAKTVRLREIVLDSPRIALDRLEDGQLNVLTLVPARSETPTAEGGPEPTRAAPAGTGWGFGIDRLILHDGGMHFRDLTIKDQEPIELSVESIEMTDLALRPGLYGEPSHLQLALALDNGTLRVNARAELRDNGIALQADVEARNLPLQRTRVYVPKVGWSALRGAVDATLTYRLETGTHNEVRGTLALRDVAVQVPHLDEPALAFQQLGVRFDPIDLMAQRAAIGEVDLRGASLVVRPQGGDLLPFLAGMVQAEPASGAATATKTTAAPAPAAAAPWHWSVASLRVADSHVRLLGTPAPVDIGVAVGASNVADTADQSPPAELTLTTGNGSVRIAGALRVVPPGFAGTVRAADLSLPELAAVSGALPPNLLQTGRLGSEMTVEVGLTVPGSGSAVAPSDLRVHGTFTLAELRLVAADPKDFTLGVRSLDVPITELIVPALIPIAGQDAAAPPIRVALGALRAVNPMVQVTRTPEGLVLPSVSPAQPGAAPPAAPQASAPARRVEVAIDSVRLTDGRVAVTDHTVKPVFEGALALRDVDLRDLHWPELAVKSVRVKATSVRQGTIDIFGALAPEGGWLEVNGERLALLPFNPYATTFSGYSVARGQASVSTKLAFGKGRYNAESWLTLHDFDLQGGAGESLFQQQFGIPLSMALALLRDIHGNIVLGVPVEGGAEGAKVGLFTIIRSALQRAIVNALASPLKLVGALVDGGDRVESLAPAPIAFRPGRAVLAPEGVEATAKLGEFLAGRPSLGIQLDAMVTSVDVRWLREQALREEWAGQGVLGKLGSLPQRGIREHVRQALDARAKDEPGELSADEAAALDGWLAQRAPPSAERLRALGTDRLAQLEAVLRDSHGIEASRITRGEVPTAAAEGVPAVRIELRSVGR